MAEFTMTDVPLLWVGAAGIAIVIAIFLIRILWVPSDDGLEFSESATSNGPPRSARPRLKTKDDVIAFFLRETKDEKLAHILADAAEMNGRDGYVDVRQGGDGQPYRVEHTHRPEDEARADRRSFSEIRAEVERLKAARDAAVAAHERDQLDRQIAWLAGGISLLWIHVPSSAEYDRQRTLVRNAMDQFKKALATDPAVPNP